MHIRVSLYVTALAAFSTAAVGQERDAPTRVELSGEAEVPGPGDRNGRGTADFRFYPDRQQICYSLTVRNIKKATAAHIHRGMPTEAGPPVVPLEAPSNGRSSACTSVDGQLAYEISSNPVGFYVNIHNASYPKGALRGQLRSFDRHPLD